MPENEKKQDAIAQSTRVRLARNYADVPFPGRMSPEQEEQIITRTENALQGERHTLRRMRDLSKNARGVLVEQHLISPELVMHRTYVHPHRREFGPYAAKRA